MPIYPLQGGGGGGGGGQERWGHADQMLHMFVINLIKINICWIYFVSYMFLYGQKKKNDQQTKTF